MIGVSSGVAATLGLLKPSPENFMQMAACMGAGIVISALQKYKSKCIRDNIYGLPFEIQI